VAEIEPGPSCNWPVGYLATADVPCGKPALIRIERKWRLPAWYVCSTHMNDPRVYAEVSANQLHWSLLADPDGTPG
jgi:hypothetical protein